MRTSADPLNYEANPRPSGRIIVKRVINCAIMFVICSGGFWDACNDGPKTRTRASMPDTFLNVVTDQWVFALAGDGVTVIVDTTTNNTRGRTLPTDIDYIAAIQPGRYDSAILANNFNATYAFDYSIRATGSPRSALLTIDIDPSAKPGIYMHEIDIEGLELSRGIGTSFTVNFPPLLGVVVIATGGAVKTGTVQKLAAGLHHSLALLDDGTVWAWGHNEYGQLGDGTTIDRTVPVPVQGFTGPVIDIDAGDRNSMALQQNRQAFTWGDNDREQLGRARTFTPPTSSCPNGHPNSDKRETSFSIARNVIENLFASGCDFRVVDIADVIGIAAGKDHSLILRSTGEVWSLGDNRNGELGRTPLDSSGDPMQSAVLPRRINSVFGRVTAISAGSDFSLGLLADGTVIGWGRNSVRQLGFNTPRDWFTAINVPFIGDVQLLRAGDSFAVANVSGESGFRGWGSNGFGQLGDGTTAIQDRPQPTATHLPISQLAPGSFHTISVLPDGQVWAWGSNAFGQMGGASAIADQTFPVRVPVPAVVSGIAGGGQHSLARDHLCGTVYSWGRNFYGQLGHSPAMQFRERPLPVYGLGELNIDSTCSVGLNVFQSDGGSVTTDLPGFDAPGCEGICSTEFGVGEVVAVTAIPSPGFNFLGWRGDCAETARGPVALLAMTESKNCFVDYGQLEIVNQPPTARFSFTPATPLINDQVDFDGNASTDDGAIVMYEWDFTDDGVIDTTGATSMFTYTVAGDYTARLRVTDDGGLTDETTQSVAVGDPGGGTPTFFSITVEFGGNSTGIVNVNPPNIDLPSVVFCAGTTCVIDNLAEGDSHVLTATATGATSFFAGWDVAECDSTDPNAGTCTIVLDGDRTVTAEFFSE